MNTYSLQSNDVHELIELVGSVLTRFADRNDKLVERPPVVTRYHARFVPKVSITGYLNRIQKYTSCGNECILASLIYLERLAKSDKNFIFSNYNVHRLLIASVMVASKFFSDVFYTNLHYAKVGGISVVELNLIELEFLKDIKFNLNATLGELQSLSDRLLTMTFFIDSPLSVSNLKIKKEVSNVYRAPARHNSWGNKNFKLKVDCRQTDLTDSVLRKDFLRYTSPKLVQRRTNSPSKLFSPSRLSSSSFPSVSFLTANSSYATPPLSYNPNPSLLAEDHFNPTNFTPSTAYTSSASGSLLTPPESAVSFS